MAEPGIKMCTLGMFIIDEIEYTEGKGRQESVMGGAGTYAAVGARLVAGAEYSESVGWIVDIGSDFPVDFRHTIDSWQTSCLFREDRGRLTTRAWNGYGPEDHRDFRYLTPKIRLDHSSLSDQLLRSQAFHLICSAERCMDLIDNILAKRVANENDKESRRSRPLFIWEPVPDLCTPNHIESFRQAIRQVDIVSPNAEELAGFFDAEYDSRDDMAAKVLEWGIGQDGEGSLVLREGKYGCTAFSRGHQIYLAAYHTPCRELQSKVVDPTGGGNAFLGALAMAMGGDVCCPSKTEVSRLLGLYNDLMPGQFSDLAISLIYAVVAASFVIEQPGMPNHQHQNSGNETWNGECFGDRMMAYTSREKADFARRMKGQAQKSSRFDVG